MKRIKRRLSNTFSHSRRSPAVNNDSAELDKHTNEVDVRWLPSENVVMSTSLFASGNGNGNGSTPQSTAAATAGTRMSSSVTLSGSSFTAACDCPLNDLNGFDAVANSSAARYCPNVNAASNAHTHTQAAMAVQSARTHNTPVRSQNNSVPIAYARIPRSSTAGLSSHNSVSVWDSQLPLSMSGDLTLANNPNAPHSSMPQSQVHNGTNTDGEQPVRRSTSPKQKEKEKRLSKLASFLRRSTTEKPARSAQEAASASNGERLANSRITRSPPSTSLSPAKQAQTASASAGSGFLRSASKKGSAQAASSAFSSKSSAFSRSDSLSASARTSALVSPSRMPHADADPSHSLAHQATKAGRALSVCVEDLPSARPADCAEQHRNSLAIAVPYNVAVLGNQHADLVSPSHCCAQHAAVPGARCAHVGANQQPPSLTNASQSKTVAVHQQNGTVALVKLRTKNDPPLQASQQQQLPNGLILHRPAPPLDETVVYANTDALVNAVPPRHHSPIYANTLYEADGEQSAAGVSKRFSLPVRYGSFHDGLRQSSHYGFQPPAPACTNCNTAAPETTNGAAAPSRNGSFRPSPSGDFRHLVSNVRPHSHVDTASIGMSMSMHEQLLASERSAQTSVHNSPLRVGHMVQSSSPHRVATDSASQLRNAVVLRNALNAAGNMNGNPNGNNQLNSNAHSVGSPLNALENGASRNLNKLSRREKRVSMYEMGYGRIESYLKLERLGEGTYATVFKGKSLLTNALVALKEIRLEHDEGAPCTAIREVSLLRQLKHANIVTLHDIIHTENALTLVFEYVGKDLKLYMEERRNLLHTHNIKLFLFQLLRGLNFCHQRNILHRDLKPQNLLISPRGELKLADFGLARAKSIPIKTYSHEVVTLWYRPPDILLGSTDYSTPIDMWGVGCILFEMATGRPMFPGTTVENQLNMIFRVLGTPTDEIWPGVEQNEEFIQLRFPSYPPENIQKLAPRLDAVAVDLLLSFLRFVPASRVSAEAAMHHRFFDVLGPAVYELRNTDSLMDVAGIVLKKDPGQLRNTATGLSHAISIHQHASQLAATGAYQIPHSHSQFMHATNNVQLPVHGAVNAKLHAPAAEVHAYQVVNGGHMDVSHKQTSVLQQAQATASKYDVSRRQSMLA